jgi:hypothetical protein
MHAYIRAPTHAPCARNAHTQSFAALSRKRTPAHAPPRVRKFTRAHTREYARAHSVYVRLYFQVTMLCECMAYMYALARNCLTWSQRTDLGTGAPAQACHASAPRVRSRYAAGVSRSLAWSPCRSKRAPRTETSRSRVKRYVRSITWWRDDNNGRAIDATRHEDAGGAPRMRSASKQACVAVGVGAVGPSSRRCRLRIRKKSCYQHDATGASEEGLRPPAAGNCVGGPAFVTR